MTVRLQSCQHALTAIRAAWLENHKHARSDARQAFDGAGVAVGFIDLEAEIAQDAKTAFEHFPIRLWTKRNIDRVLIHDIRSAGRHHRRNFSHLQVGAKNAAPCQGAQYGRHHSNHPELAPSAHFSKFPWRISAVTLL